MIIIHIITYMSPRVIVYLTVLSNALMSSSLAVTVKTSCPCFQSRFMVASYFSQKQRKLHITRWLIWAFFLLTRFW